MRGIYKVLWFGRHSPSKEQVGALETIFKDNSIEVVHLSKTFNSGKEVVEAYKDYNCDDLVVILPYHMIQEVIEGGVKPLRCIMRRKFTEDSGINNGVKFEFLGYERLEEVKIKSKTLYRKNRKGEGTMDDDEAYNLVMRGI